MMISLNSDTRNNTKSCPKCSVKWFLGFLLIQAIFILIYAHFILQWNISGTNHHHEIHSQKQQVKPKGGGGVGVWEIKATEPLKKSWKKPLKNKGNKGTTGKSKKPQNKNISKIVEPNSKKPMKLKIMKTKKDFDEDDYNIVNYMRNADRVLTLPLLINTTHCKIPDFKPIDEETQSLMKRPPPPNCSTVSNSNDTRHSRWNSKIDEKNRLIVTPPSSGVRDGDKFKCCYKVITRAKNETGKREKDRDFSVDLSSCIPLHLSLSTTGTKIKAEFIVVECFSFNNTAKNKVPLKDVGNNMSSIPEYREFHAIPTTNKNPRRAKILKKQEFWGTKIKERTNSSNNSSTLPPNILIIAHDSTSRLNFRRQMYRTLTFLHTHKAIELLGYTRVGESTFPNLIPGLSGYDRETYMDICTNGSANKNYQDSCPLIWKEFDAANYLTAFLEDEPGIGTFHYKKPGFFEQPVDFSLRPVMLQATIQRQLDNPKTRNRSLQYITPCIGQSTNDQFILAYLKKLVFHPQKKNVPHIIFSLATRASHDYFNGLQNSDEEYAKFLEEIEKTGYLKNTILFVLSDHGHRYGLIKQTLVGGYEENLPNFWVLLGPEVKEKYPKWEKMLKINARRLTSPFHFYWTLKHILGAFSDVPRISAEDIIVERKVKASSLFKEVKEDSTCSDIGVKDEFCSCGLKQSLPLEDELAQAAAKVSLAQINKELDGEKACKKLEIRKFVGAVIKHQEQKNKKKAQVTVSLLLDPGKTHVEATLHVKLDRGQKFNIEGVAHIQRINQLNQTSIWCVDSARLEQFCHCPEKGKGKSRKLSSAG